MRKNYLKMFGMKGYWKISVCKSRYVATSPPHEHLYVLTTYLVDHSSVAYIHLPANCKCNKPNDFEVRISITGLQKDDSFAKTYLDFLRFFYANTLTNLYPNTFYCSPKLKYFQMAYIGVINDLISRRGISNFMHSYKLLE